MFRVVSRIKWVVSSTSHPLRFPVFQRVTIQITFLRLHPTKQCTITNQRLTNSPEKWRFQRDARLIYFFFCSDISCCSQQSVAVEFICLQWTADWLDEQLIDLTKMASTSIAETVLRERCPKSGINRFLKVFIFHFQNDNFEYFFSPVKITIWSFWDFGPVVRASFES